MPLLGCPFGIVEDVCDGAELGGCDWPLRLGVGCGGTGVDGLAFGVVCCCKLEGGWGGDDAGFPFIVGDG